MNVKKAVAIASVLMFLISGFAVFLGYQQPFNQANTGKGAIANSFTNSNTSSNAGLQFNFQNLTSEERNTTSSFGPNAWISTSISGDNGILTVGGNGLTFYTKGTFMSPSFTLPGYLTGAAYGNNSFLLTGTRYLNNPGIIMFVYYPANNTLVNLTSVFPSKDLSGSVLYETVFTNNTFYITGAILHNNNTTAYSIFYSYNIKTGALTNLTSKVFASNPLLEFFEINLTPLGMMLLSYGGPETYLYEFNQTTNVSLNLSGYLPSNFFVSSGVWLPGDNMLWDSNELFISGYNSSNGGCLNQYVIGLNFSSSIPKVNFIHSIGGYHVTSLTLYMGQILAGGVIYRNTPSSSTISAFPFLATISNTSHGNLSASEYFHVPSNFGAVSTVNTIGNSLYITGGILYYSNFASVSLSNFSENYVSFQVSNYSSQSCWFMNIDGSRIPGAGNGVYNLGLPIGTYSYTITPCNDNYTSISGTITVTPGINTKNIVFSSSIYNPTVENSNIIDGSSKISLLSGSQMYIYGFATSGTGNVQPFQNGSYSVGYGANGLIDTGLAVSNSSSNCFVTSGNNYYDIGGVGVSGVSSYQIYNKTITPPVEPNTYLNESFTVSHTSLVVFYGLGGGQGFISLNVTTNLNGIQSSIPIQIDSIWNQVGGVANEIAQAMLVPGTYRLNELTTNNDGGSSTRSDQIAAFVFNSAGVKAYPVTFKETGLPTSKVWSSNSTTLLGAMENNTSPVSTFIQPNLSFNNSGMIMSGIDGTYQTTGIQANTPFTGNFTVNVEASVIQGTSAPMEILLTNAMATNYVFVAEDACVSNTPYYGMFYGYTGSGLGDGNSNGIIYSSPSYGTLYQIQISVNTSGFASITVYGVQNGVNTVLGTESGLNIGTGPFYLTLGQKIGLPSTSIYPSISRWVSAVVTNDTSNSTLLYSNFETSSINSLFSSQWTVDLNGYIKSSTSSSISYMVPNGNYTFKIFNVTGFKATPSSGKITVSNSGVTQDISFVSNSITQLPSVKLIINVHPQSADLFINGVLMNSNSSGTYQFIESYGYYFINATEYGYSTYTNYISISSNHSYYINITLVKLTGYGYLSGSVNPSDAMISASGFVISVSDGGYNISLPSGTYYVSATAKGYQSFMKEVNISAGGTTTLNINLLPTSNSFELSGFVNPANSSVVVSGMIAYVNSSGFYDIYLPAGQYSISVDSSGYFAQTRNISLYSNLQDENFTLKTEPVSTSSTSSSNVTATGYNVTISNLNTGNGIITVNYTATVNGTLTVVIPYSEIKNSTISQVLSSRLYINGKPYTNFSVAISSHNGTYNVVLSVYNLSGDPSMSWLYSPSAKLPVSGGQNYLSSFYEIFAVGLVIAVIAIASGAIYMTSRRKK